MGFQDLPTSYWLIPSERKWAPVYLQSVTALAEVRELFPLTALNSTDLTFLSLWLAYISYLLPTGRHGPQNVLQSEIKLWGCQIFRQ